jgi:mono/diheme cytochrome c family protein
VKAAAVVSALLLAILLAGCDQNMEEQPTGRSYSAMPQFGGSTMRTPPSGTVAQDDDAREQAIRQKPQLTSALLARGQDRFSIYCSPCHGRTGQGNGRIVQRGMPHPTNYHDPRLRTADDQHFFNVITNGYGAMYSYAMRVSPRDRWAIVAYIRALQLSHHAVQSDVPDEEKAKLEEGK